MIKYRLFLAMLAASGAAVICMFLIVQWSIGRGFLTYVNTIEKERMTRLSEVLEQKYAEMGSWDFLRYSPSAWFRLVATTIPREPNEPDRPERPDREWYVARQAQFFASRTGAHRLPRLAHRFEMRVLLLDEAHRRVAGPPVEAERGITFRELRLHGKTVGYLGMLPRLRLTERHQLLFVKQQKLAMGMIAGAILLVSAALSLPLANRLVSPIKKLASSMHRLASGRFDTRVTIESSDELGQLGRDFNTLALTLEKNEQARRHWVADISHELRTPLAVLRGEIEAIQDGVRQATPESMRSLHGEVMQLTRLVDDLYQLSLHDIGGLSYRKEDIDLKELLGSSLESYRSEFEQKQIALKEELPASSFPVFADPDRLHQLFDNLLDNALKYTDPGGVLWVRLKRKGHVGEIEFEDSAPTVPEPDLEKLFERLYRVESSRNRSLGGAGLGLALCRNIVEAHEGKISAHQSSLGGLLVRIELPLARS